MLKDPDAEVSTTALGELDAVHDYDYILGEQHENIATLEHGIVLITQDESLPRHDRINRIEGAPCDAELAHSDAGTAFLAACPVCLNRCLTTVFDQ